MPKLPTHLTKEEMEVQQLIQGELIEWLAELEREGHGFSSVVDASFFDQLDPHVELAKHKLRYLEAVKDKVALKGYRDSVTGEIKVDWQGDAQEVTAKLNSGGGVKYSETDLERWLARI